MAASKVQRKQTMDVESLLLYVNGGKSPVATAKEDFESSGKSPASVRQWWQVPSGNGVLWYCEPLSYII